jgi:hypothetical protein
MIPAFPQFKRLELDDQAEIEAFARGLPPNSDYHFAGMWCWDTENRIDLSREGGCLILRSTDYLTEAPFYSFFQRDGHDASCLANRLLDRAAAEELEPCLRLMPEESIVGLKADCFAVCEDRDNHDYLVDSAPLASLRGHRFKRMRNRVNRFSHMYPNVRTCRLDLSCRSVRDEIDTLIGVWEENRAHSVPRERQAIQRLIAIRDRITLVATGLYVGGRLVGFDLSELLENDYAMAHFWKADVRCRGVYDYLSCAIARTLLDQGCRWWNCEQDLGLPGLRNAKAKLQSVRFLKKYTVTRRVDTPQDEPHE